MITVSVLLILMGFYFWYSTSSKVKFASKEFPENRLRKHKNLTKIVGFFLLFGGFLIQVSAYGFASGILTAFVVLMLAGSLCILLVPLKIFNTIFIAIVMLTAFLIELFVL